MERIHVALEQSPQKSTNHRDLSTHYLASLYLKPHRLQLILILTTNNKRKQMEFCDLMMEIMEGETFISHFIFSDEVTFHLNGTVNHYNVLIWRIELPHNIAEHKRDFAKVNVFCAAFKDKDYSLGKHYNRATLSQYVSTVVLPVTVRRFR